MGHLRRCSALAVELKKSGATVIFLCRVSGIDIVAELAGIADEASLMDWRTIPEHDAREVARTYEELGVDVAVIDHYRVDSEYQQHLLASGVRWMQFDWSARQPLWANWVLNASFGADESVYQSLKRREETILLLGPQYVPIRPDFGNWRSRVKFREDVATILLTFGGGDDRQATVFFLEALRPLDPSIQRVVLASSANPHLSNIRNWMNTSKDSNVTLMVDEHHVAQQMAAADLAIISGGTTTFEAAAMGLPSMIIQLADNQIENADACEKVGSAFKFGPIESLSVEEVRFQVESLISKTDTRRQMSFAGLESVDAQGSARLAHALLRGAGEATKWPQREN